MGEELRGREVEMAEEDPIGTIRKERESRIRKVGYAIRVIQMH